MKNSFNFWNNLWTRSTSTPVKILVKKLFCELQSPPWYKLYLRTACEHKTVWHCLEQDVWRRFEGMWTWTCNSIRWYQIRTLSVVQWASVRVTISFTIWIKDRSSIQKKTCIRISECAFTQCAFYLIHVGHVVWKLWKIVIHDLWLILSETRWVSHSQQDMFAAIKTESISCLAP